MDAFLNSVGVFTLASSVLCDACLRRPGDFAGALCSAPRGAGFGLRAEPPGSGLEIRFVFVLEAELGVRDTEGVVARGVDGRGAEAAVWRES